MKVREGSKGLFVLEAEEKKEYKQFLEFHVAMKKIHEPGYKSCMACKAPKGFDKI